MKKQLILLSLVSGLALSGRADTITYDQIGAGIPYTLTDFSGSLSFPKFDQPGDTLTSVVFELDSSITTFLMIQNGSPGTENGKYGMEVTAKITDTVLNPGNSDVLTDISTPLLKYSLLPGETTSFNKTASSSDSATFTTPDALAHFTGSGTVSVPLSFQAYTVLIAGGGNPTASQTTSGKATGKVIYTFNKNGGGPVIPEPADYAAAFGLGLAGFVGYRRFRS